LWQEARDPECKTASRNQSDAYLPPPKKKAPESWETTLVNNKATLQAIWPITKSFINRDGPRAPTAIHSLLSIKCHPSEKANTTADCLEKQFTPHGLSEENHERWVHATRVQALLQAVDNDPPERIKSM
jgi:hypothetical protein